MYVKSNRRNKAAFSNFCCSVRTGSKFKRIGCILTMSPFSH